MGLRQQIELAADGLDLVDEFVLHHAGARPAVLHDVGDLRRREAEVDRHGHQPGSRQRHVHLHPFDAVVGQQRDTVALGQAQPEQPVGQPRRAFVPVARS